MASSPRGTLSLSLAQLNPTVGDIGGNLELARAARASAAGCDLLVFTELFISGYPPEDLVLRPAFVAACRDAIERLALETADFGPAMLIGAPWLDNGAVHNSVLLLDNGRIEAVRHKVELPNYGVFDEKRVFRAGPMPEPIVFHGVRLGVPICEDIWVPDIAAHFGRVGCDILVVINGSPYWRNKQADRLAIARGGVGIAAVPMIYVNMVGGQDELVFDGGSFGLEADGTTVFQMPQFETALTRIELASTPHGWRIEPDQILQLPAVDEADWRACVLGLRDYVEKNRFPGVVLGLSGGVDSAVVAAMAVDALGSDRVHCLMLPYRYTSDQSLADAASCAVALGVRYDILSIADAVNGFESVLAPLFVGLPRDVTEENLQARTRGVLLMAVSNKLGSLLITTGNKSEVSVGYATLYGDMNGGFNPIKDLFKTDVYRLARWRNAHRGAGLLGPTGEVVPEAIIVRPPTAELRENQTDQDSLPPYETLDAILVDLVERERSVADIIAAGHDPRLVRRIEHLVHLSEYKRRQAAPGVKISGRNFGRDRRYPITNRFREGRD